AHVARTGSEPAPRSGAIVESDGVEHESSVEGLELVEVVLEPVLVLDDDVAAAAGRAKLLEELDPGPGNRWCGCRRDRNRAPFVDRHGIGRRQVRQIGRA